MKICAAHSSPINPPGATPKLTRSQVWEGLKVKSRDPVRFVPVIQSCVVVEETAAGLTRKVHFKPGTGPQGEVTEVVTFFEGVRVRSRSRHPPRHIMTVLRPHLQADFKMVGNDTVISNIISTGDGESDLYLTFSFVWDLPDIQEGTDAAKAKQEQFANGAGTAVQQSVKEIRALVQSGELGV